jgi:enamine deaminase RidA (YjgF/YER057c/UK114 family)
VARPAVPPHAARVPELTHIPAPSGVAPAHGYSHVVWGEGRFVAISGQIALDENGDVVGPGDPAAQVRQIFANLRRCLDAAGATFADVAKVTFFATDWSVLPAMREALGAHFDAARPPASTAVQVTSLVRPELLLEVEAFAIVRA